MSIPIPQKWLKLSEMFRIVINSRLFFCNFLRDVFFVIYILHTCVYQINCVRGNEVRIIGIAILFVKKLTVGENMISALAYVKRMKYRTLISVLGVLITDEKWHILWYFAWLRYLSIHCTIDTIVLSRNIRPQTGHEVLALQVLYFLHMLHPPNYVTMPIRGGELI